VTIAVGRARADTPGCERIAHLNNAGASLPPRVVVDTVVDYLEREAVAGGYELEETDGAAIEAVYESVARLVGASASEIALCENATRAWDLAFYSIDFQKGDRILTSRAEYASNVMACLQTARRKGASVEIVPDDESGALDVEALADLMDERVKLAAFTHVGTQGGLVAPVEAAGKVVADWPALYLVDACQSAGQLPLDVDAIGCDFLSATGRKFLRGPRGTGFLFVRDTVKLEPLFVDLHSATWVETDRYEVRDDARRYEAFERSPALALGLGAAVDYALDVGVDEIAERVGSLAAILRTLLADIPGVVMHDRGDRKCGIVTFTVDGWEPEDLAASLRGDRIQIWYSVVTSARLDMEARGLRALARASVHYYNTEDELEQLAAAVRARAVR